MDTNARINENSTRTEMIEWVSGWDPEHSITADCDAEEVASELCRLDLDQIGVAPSLELATEAVREYQETL